MRVQFGPPGWFRRLVFITGYIARRKADNVPPYKGCLIVVESARSDRVAAIS
jgi:hypothetical protein